MVAHVLRLRLALLVGALRGDRGSITRTVVAALLFIAAVVATCVGVLMLGEQEPDAAYVVTVLAGSGLLLGVTIAPLIAGTVDQLDPRRFVLFGMEPSALAGALALAALVSVPSLGLIAGATSMAVMWTSQGVPAIVAVLCLVIAVATCLLLARVSMALAALVLRQRRSRELSGLFALGLVVVVMPVVIFIASLEWRGRVPTQLDAAADVLALTPFGAVWAIPGLTLGDDTALLVWAWIIAVLTLIAVAGGFLLVVRRMLSTVEPPSTGPGRGGLGWFAVAPATPAGAIAARGIVYWMKDRRYIVNVAIVPFAAVIAALPLLVAGVSPQTVALVPVLILALFLGWIPHNDTAYDSTAVWMHVVAGVRGVSDRFGRLIPITLVAVPLLAIAIPVSVALYDRWAVLPAVVGVCASLFLSGLGLSSIASAVAPYAVTRPGDSPFLQPQRAGSGVASQALVLAGAIVASTATLFWAWQTITDDIEQATTTMWVGLGTGFGVLFAGLLIGAFAFEVRATRLMEFAESN